MDAQEVIVNLWYVMDEQGVIYSLRAKAYVVSGSDDSKLQFLRDRANTDYLIAQPFTIPERFHVQIGEGRQAKVMPVAHVSMLDTLDSPIALFEDALKALESQMPAQSRVTIPQDPIACTTPLMQDSGGTIRPHFTGQRRF